MTREPLLRAALLIASCMALEACLPGPLARGALLPGLDSPSATCRNSLSACVALFGKEAGSALIVLNVALDQRQKAAIEQALTQCADQARSDVLLRHQGDFQKLSPTAEECNQLAKNSRRKGMTWAMQLGVEMHEEALDCTEARLNTLRPGGFSREPRYRYDSRTKQWKRVSPEEERALEESGNRGELRGSLMPDVVIHAENPLRAQAVYDFKFPCVNVDKPPKWEEYPAGHPYESLSQDKMYKNAFNVQPLRVIPRLGIIHDPE